MKFFESIRTVTRRTDLSLDILDSVLKQLQSLHPNGVQVLLFNSLLMCNSGYKTACIHFQSQNTLNTTHTKKIGQSQLAKGGRLVLLISVSYFKEGLIA